MEQHLIDEFKTVVYNFYKENYRSMPWRENTNPYYILVSEYMLQQTQVNRVIDKFLAFTSNFPDFGTLASATNAEVLAQWNGLGYNRRALYLKRCAESIVSNYDGQIPQSMSELCKLPGIGKATASAILVYSFNMPHSFLETNVKTVLIHHFFKHEIQISDKELEIIAQEVLDKENPRAWHWALMDYGTWIKKNIGNLSKQSKSYTKQSKFEGSRRQVRGRILKALIEKNEWSHADLINHLAEPATKYYSIVEDLSKEGFIENDSHQIVLKNK